MRRLTALLLLAFLPGCGGRGGAPPRAPADPGTLPAGVRWAVDPREPGPDLPPVGRSLFDFLVAKDGAYDVPFPFPALAARIEERLGVAPGGPSPLRRVLLPMGRSLQRNAAAPRFFTFPRAVLGVDAEPAPAAGGLSRPLLRDRLYLGYQEKSAVVEVIGYNEAAGRFEFQVVEDYRPGGARRVVYARRAVCTACHQNAAPIFPRQLWNETNANPEVARRLAAEGRDFYGFPTAPGVDVAYALDAATDRADRLSAYQALWRQGCGGGRAPAAVRCRARLAVAALQYRLSGGRGFEASPAFRHEAAGALAAARRRLWPRGLAIPNPDLPDRDPLADRVPGPAAPAPAKAGGPSPVDAAASALLADLVRRSHVPAPLEPLNPRPPLEVWGPAEAARDAERAVVGLADFLAEEDVRRLDAGLLALGAGVPERTYRAPCAVEPRRSGGAVDRVALSCGGGQGGLALAGRFYPERGGRVGRGTIERLGLGLGRGREELRDLAVAGGELRRRGSGWTARLELAQAAGPGSPGLHVRRADGGRVASVELSWEERPAGGSAAALAGEAAVAVRDDFAPVHAAAARVAAATMAGRSDAFAGAPFRRAAVLPALFAALGLPAAEPCCADPAGLPPAVRDVLPAPRSGRDAGLAAAVPAVRAFDYYCASCHRTPEPTPPNFLYGPPERVRASLAHCAERIFFRLEMWRLARPDRPKSPMPPLVAFKSLDVTPRDWPTHPDLELLRAYAAGRLRAETGREPTLGALEARGYENLRGCVE